MRIIIESRPPVVREMLRLHLGLSKWDNGFQWSLLSLGSSLGRNGRRHLGSAPNLLKTSTAQNRPPLCGFKRNCRIGTAFGACYVCLWAGTSPQAIPSSAPLAALWVVRELFFAEEGLLAGAEHEFSSAFKAFQKAIRKLHGWLTFPRSLSSVYAYDQPS